MMFVALIMRPWIIIMRCIPGVQAFILADDVLILVTGRGMIGCIVEAINKTHAYLHAMGAKVAPDKNYNFASTAEKGKSGSSKPGGKASRRRFKWCKILGTLELT